MSKRQKHSTIKFGKKTVTKTAAPELLRVEVEKTRRAFEIGKSSGLFYVPEVLDYNESKGVVVFNRLDIRTVFNGVPWGRKRIALGESLGKALAAIHRELVLPDNMIEPLPEGLSHDYNEVFLHGDLSVENVCVGETWPPIVILDWQMTSVYGGRAVYGTCYFDILWFIANLITRPQTRFLFVNPVAPVIKAFIIAYFRESSIPFDGVDFKKYAERFFDIYMSFMQREIMKNSKGRARMLWPRCQAIQIDFINSINELASGI